MLVAMMGNEHKAYWDCKTDPSLPLSLTYLLTHFLTHFHSHALPLSLSDSSRSPSPSLPLPHSCRNLPETPEALPNPKPQKHCRT